VRSSLGLDVKYNLPIARDAEPLRYADWREQLRALRFVREREAALDYRAGRIRARIASSGIRHSRPVTAP
jgi:hypothetical protein